VGLDGGLETQGGKKGGKRKRERGNGKNESWQLALTQACPHSPALHGATGPSGGTHQLTSGGRREASRQEIKLLTGKKEKSTSLNKMFASTEVAGTVLFLKIPSAVVLSVSPAHRLAAHCRRSAGKSGRRRRREVGGRRRRKKGTYKERRRRRKKVNDDPEGSH